MIAAKYSILLPPFPLIRRQANHPGLPSTSVIIADVEGSCQYLPPIPKTDSRNAPVAVLGIYQRGKTKFPYTQKKLPHKRQFYVQ